MPDCGRVVHAARRALHALRRRARVPGRRARAWTARRNLALDRRYTRPSAVRRSSTKGGRAQMRAVDAIMECLKAEGVDVVFGLPGGANLPTYDALVRRRHPPHPRAPRGRRRPRRRGLREGDRQGRRRVRAPVRPGRDEPGHADLRRDDGLGARSCSSPARCAPTCSAPTASRRPTSIGITMPVVKHSLHDPAPAGDPAGDPRGLPHRPHRPARPGRSSTSRRTSRAPTSPTSRSPTCACPATSRRRRATRSRSARPPRRWPRAAPGDLRGRRRRQRQRLGGARRVRASWTASRSPAR